MNLYKLDNKKQIRIWTIDPTDYGLRIEHGVLGGAMQEKYEQIGNGKAGRSLDDQIKSRINSRVVNQLAKGYKYSIEEANKGATNQLGLGRPMLAQPIKTIKKIDWTEAYVQFKYDGHRCLITKKNGMLIAYSRNGKIIESIDHILENLKVPEGYTLDGELYCHGETLQTIASWVKRKQADSAKLKYHVYDAMIDIPYAERYTYLHSIQADNLIIVPTTPVFDLPTVMSMFPLAIDQGYEGLILRQGSTGYEESKRSKSLIKIKQFLDDEFYVTDITQSADGWGVLQCITDKGKEFSVSAPGTMEMKRQVLDDKLMYINKFIKIEYANLTPDGIPFHPVAISWRNKNDE